MIPKLGADGTAPDNLPTTVGIYGGSYWTSSDPGVREDVSECRNITDDGIQLQSASGDFVFSGNRCITITGRAHLIVFNQKGCPGVGKKARYADYILPDITDDDMKYARLPCYSPGSKVQSFMHKKV